MSFFFPIAALGLLAYLFTYGTKKHIEEVEQPDRPAELGGPEASTPPVLFQKHISEPHIVKPIDVQYLPGINHIDPIDDGAIRRVRIPTPILSKAGNETEELVQVGEGSWVPVSDMSSGVTNF